ncbi:MAG: nuclease-related domain-containing protein [Candidatus Parcubacteria bacterium]|nr:nuclease-related domain-containing protein [Candidatus Parcubacteria bacterium]
MFYFIIFFVIVMVAVPFLIKWRLPYFIGRGGEKFVTKKLLQLDSTNYKVLNDLLLPSNGRLDTTQIDHVVVSNYGIFCIETKAYQGWIFGEANQEYWTQVIYRHKERFYNPLRQNYAHVKAVEELIKLKYPEARVFSLVAFPDADKLKITGTDSVGFAYDVVKRIGSFSNIIFSDTERDEICEILTNANIADKEARKLHNQGARELKG